jgi:hypothetical protein
MSQNNIKTQKKIQKDEPFTQTFTTVSCHSASRYMCTTTHTCTHERNIELYNLQQS